jgi:hypothetical protein
MILCPFIHFDYYFVFIEWNNYNLQHLQQQQTVLHCSRFLSVRPAVRLFRIFCRFCCLKAGYFQHILHKHNMKIRIDT